MTTLKMNKQAVECPMFHFIQLNHTDNGDGSVERSEPLNVERDILRFEDLSLNSRTREVFRGNRSIKSPLVEPW